MTRTERNPSVASTEAGLLRLHCRITAHVPDAADAVALAVSDEHLLAEVRRRGLANRF